MRRGAHAWCFHPLAHDPSSQRVHEGVPRRVEDLAEHVVNAVTCLLSGGGPISRKRCLESVSLAVSLVAFGSIVTPCGGRNGLVHPGDGHPSGKTGQRYMFRRSGIFLVVVTKTALSFPLTQLFKNFVM